LSLNGVQVGVRVDAVVVVRLRTRELKTAENTVVITAVSTHGELCELCHFDKMFDLLGWIAGW
jgi:hypothetical protein